MAPVLLYRPGVDLHETKDRVAVALVESIFRRARYRVKPFDADRTKPRFVREDFAPSFFVFVPGPEGVEREFLIDVTYRPFVEQFISLENKRRESSIFVLAHRHWPGLHFVLVTDHPAPGRSCFQAVTLGERGTEVRLRTVDLVELPEFGIFPHNVADHEELLLRIFAMLAADRHRREQPHAV